MQCRYCVRNTSTSKGWYDHPCGRCVTCRITKRQEWTLRLLLEMREHSVNYFITLTYEHLHAGGNLMKDEISRYIKRLRSNMSKYETVKNPKTGRKKKICVFRPKIRFFGCGEYGEEKGRPHYHLIVISENDFNIQFGLNKYGQTVVTGSEFHKAWKEKGSSIGIVDVAIVPGTTDSIRVAQYLAGYTLKKYFSDVEEDRVAEFIAMSSKPGIGTEQICRILKVTEKHVSRQSDLQMIRVNGKLWPLGRTLREAVLRKTGEKKHGTGKGIADGWKLKAQQKLFGKDPEMYEQYQKHVQEKEHRARKMAEKWKEVKRKNMQVVI